MEIKNLEETARRIKKAVSKQEKIILYADADLDGATSLILLEETIKSLGGQVFLAYFPDRETEGYGLNEPALNYLKDYAPALLITLDCGISNFKEVKLAQTHGFEVIIIDHHEILGWVPEKALVVDPKQPEDSFPFKKLATAGIVFRLIKIILGGSMSRVVEQSFLELVCLATMADLMPEEGENKLFVENGLRALPSTFRPGLRAILKLFSGDLIFNRQLAQRVIPILNITDIKQHLTESYLLLVASAGVEVDSLVQEVFQKSQQRGFLIIQFVEEAGERINRDDHFIFEGDFQWPQVLTGAIASRICNKYRKPTFIFRRGAEKSRGSVRTTKEVDSVAALKYCSDFLEMYGGHAQASGFTVQNENLGKFKDCLREYFQKFN